MNIKMISLDNITIPDNPKVLIIEDDQMIIETISEWLSIKGYQVQAAEEGMEGLVRFKEYRPHLVLLDLCLAGTRGVDVLRKIKDINCEIPVIIVSGLGDINDVIETRREGAWDYMTKPIDYARFDHILRSNLEKSVLLQQNRIYSEGLEREVAERTKELELRNRELLEINELLEIEKRISQVSENKFYRLAEATRQGIAICEGLKIINVNPMLRKWLGDLGKDLIGQNISHIVAKDYHDYFFQKIKLLDKTRFEVELISPTEERLFVEMVYEYDPITNNSTIIMDDNMETTKNDTTGLIGPKILNDRFDVAIKYARRKKTFCAAVYIDINGLGETNNRFGHEMGDNLLRTFANAMSEKIRSFDTLAHKHGDEFVAILNDISDIGDLRRRMEDIIQGISKKSFNERPLTASFGIAIYDPQNSFEEDDITIKKRLLNESDSAMLEAKEHVKINYKAEWRSSSLKFSGEEKVFIALP